MKRFVPILIFVSILVCLPAAVSAETADSGVDRLKRVKEISENHKSVESHSGAKWLESSESKESDLSPSRVIQALALCLGVFFIFVAVMKRWNKSAFAPVQKQIEILEKVALNQKTALVRARYNHKELLLAVGAEQVNLLSSSIFPAEQNTNSLFEEELMNKSQTNGFKDEMPCDIDVNLSA